MFPTLRYLRKREEGVCKFGRAAIVCILRQLAQQLLLTVIYCFPFAVQNVTYMCTKVYAVDEGPVTKGCYTQTVDGYDVELCVCESSPGPYKPCNGGTSRFAIVGLILISLLVVWI